MKIAYLIDSSAGIKENPEKDIYMVPLEIVKIKDNKETIFKAGIDIDIAKLAKEFASGGTFKTGQAVIGEVENKINKLLETYDCVIGIPIDRQISGTFNSWQNLESEFGSDKFHVVDCSIVECGVVFVLNEIKEYLNSNPYNPEAIDKLVNEIRKKISGVVVVNDVSQLVAGGRLKGWKALIIKTLKIKILIKMDAIDGHLEYFDKTRDDNEAKQKVLDYLDSKTQWQKNGIKRAQLVTTFIDDKENQQILNEFKKILPKDVELTYTYISSVVAVHTGINAYSLIMQAN